MSDALENILTKLETETDSQPDGQNRLIQHLIELDYIPLLLANALTSENVGAAKIRFLEDSISSGLFPNAIFEAAYGMDEDDFFTMLLEKITDIDEGIVFNQLPDSGEVSLQSRMLHYRLDIFGMWPFPVSKPFDLLNSKAALTEIAGFLNTDILTAINLIGNTEALTQRLLAIHPPEDFILTVLPKNPIEHKLRRQLSRTQAFRRQLLDDFGERNDFFKYLNREILKERPDRIDYDFLNNEFRKPFKRFVMRLIQVHQWQEGSYNGLLDSDIGEVTIRSILNSIDLYNESERKNIKEHRVLNHIGNEYFLFNALFFLQEYVITPEREVDPQEQILSDLIHNIGQANDANLNAFELNLAVLKTEISQGTENKPRERKGLLQRVYYGFKKFLKKIASFSRKIFGWVVQLTEKFKAFLKKVFGKIFDDIRTGIRAFIDGIRFLLGNKETVTQNDSGMLISAIRVDGDCYNFALGSSAFALAEEHNRMVKYHVRSMHFALTIVGGVLKTFLLSISVFSWPLLIFTIARLVKNIKESFQKLNMVPN